MMAQRLLAWGGYSERESRFMKIFKWYSMYVAGAIEVTGPDLEIKYKSYAEGGNGK